MALFSRRGKNSSDSGDEAAEPVETAPVTDADAGTTTDTTSEAGLTGSATEQSAPVDGVAAADPAGVEAEPAPASDATGARETAATPETADDADRPVRADDVDETEAESVPQVNISVSTYGKPRGAASVAASDSPAPGDAHLRRMRRGPAEAPAPTQSVPGLPDNVLVRAALATLPEKPQPADIISVMRQLMQGHLFVRVRGDAKALLAEGKEITMAISAIGDDKYLLAFTGGDALQASVRTDGDTQTSALGQPTTQVLRNVVAGPYAGVIIDHATPGKRVVLPKALVEKALEEADPSLQVKNALAAARTPETKATVAAALPEARLWVAANNVPGQEGQVGVAEARDPDGRRRLEVFTHPLEIAALGRSDRAVPLTAKQLGKALAAEESLIGILIDPAGPWIELDRDDLVDVIALAEAPDDTTEAADSDAGASQTTES